jgi:hypothetical protein
MTYEVMSSGRLKSGSPEHVLILYKYLPVSLPYLTSLAYVRVHIVSQ